MTDEYLNYFIEMFYYNQNLNPADYSQKGLYTKEEYYRLFKPVSVILNTHKDSSIEELRSLLFEQSGIEKSVKDFIQNRGMAPGLVASYGTPHFKETITIGNRQEVELDEKKNIVSNEKKMTKDTIFDLASITKLFTSLSVLKLVEYGVIRLEYDITFYLKELKELSGVPVYRFLTFNAPLITNARIDKAKSKEEAEELLFSSKINPDFDGRKPYTDMGAMILKYLVEKVTGMKFYDFIDNMFLSKLNMNNTFVNVPDKKLNMVASTDFEGSYYKDGNFNINIFDKKGMINDPKAQVMEQINGNLSGHAGLFSSSNDMTRLAKALIKGIVLKRDTMILMAKNATGRFYGTEKDKKVHIQYLGCLCYSKNPYLDDSEVHHALSGEAFASAGFTGTQLTIDPINKTYLFMGSNRTHNRMKFIDKVHENKITSDSLGKKTIVLPNGREMIDSRRFAWDRDKAVIHPIIELTMQYRLLEHYLHYKGEREKVKIREL